MFHRKVSDQAKPANKRIELNQLNQYVRKSIFKTHTSEYNNDVDNNDSDYDVLENVPLKSPYPDYKRTNIISPTKSPQKYDI